jgi:hypothetical protein
VGRRIFYFWKMEIGGWAGMRQISRRQKKPVDQLNRLMPVTAIRPPKDEADS